MLLPACASAGLCSSPLPGHVFRVFLGGISERAGLLPRAVVHSLLLWKDWHVSAQRTGTCR